jgi:hypothetical protein
LHRPLRGRPNHRLGGGGESDRDWLGGLGDRGYEWDCLNCLNCLNCGNCGNCGSCGSWGRQIDRSLYTEHAGVVDRDEINAEQPRSFSALHHE